MSDNRKRIMHYLIENKLIIGLILEAIGIVIAVYGLIKGVLPDDLSWVNTTVLLILIYLGFLLTCLVILTKKHKSIIYEGQLVFKYSRKKRHIARFVLSTITATIVFYFIVVNRNSTVSLERGSNLSPVKILISNFQYEAKIDEFSNSLINNLNNEFIKREFDSVKAIKQGNYYSIDSIDYQRLQDLFSKSKAQKGIFVCGEYWISTNALNCNLFIYNLPLAYKLFNSRSNNFIFIKSPDTVKIRDIQGQVDYVSNIILAIIYQRMLKFGDSNQIVENMLVIKEMRKSIRMLCLRIAAENYMSLKEYQQAKRLFKKAMELDPSDKYVTSCYQYLSDDDSNIEPEMRRKKTDFVPQTKYLQPDTIFQEKDLLSDTIGAKRLKPNFARLEFSENGTTLQLDTNKMLTRHLPIEFKSKLNDFNFKSAVSFGSISGEFNSNGININIYSNCLGCVKSAQLNLFSSLDSAAFAEILIPDPTDFSIMIPYSLLYKSRYAKVAMDGNVPRIIISAVVHYNGEAHKICLSIFRK